MWLVLGYKSTQAVFPMPSRTVLQPRMSEAGLETSQTLVQGEGQTCDIHDKPATAGQRRSSHQHQSRYAKIKDGP
jgi:hypothetical protein